MIWTGHPYGFRLKYRDALIVVLNLIFLNIIITKFIVIGQSFHVQNIFQNTKLINIAFYIVPDSNYQAEFEIHRTIYNAKNLK